MWRAAFPIENLDKDPEVKEHYKMIGPDDSEPIVRTYLGPGTYAMTLTRPETMIWIINHNVSFSLLTAKYAQPLTRQRLPVAPPRAGATRSSQRKSWTPWTRAQDQTRGTRG